MKDDRFCATCPPEVKTWEKPLTVHILKNGMRVWMCAPCKEELKKKQTKQ